MNQKIKLLITIFLGPLGVHKFIDKQYVMGFLYWTIWNWMDY